MMSASEGVHGKADVVREDTRILCYKSAPNADKGERVKKSENLANVINGCSLNPKVLIVSVSLGP